MPTPRQYPDAAARQAAYRARQAVARREEQAAKGLPTRPALATMPGQARWDALVHQAHLLLQVVQEEMQEYHDQRSELWQESDRGETFRERLEALQAAQEAVAEVGT